MSSSRLRIDNLCKSYAGPVLRHVSLTISAGEIHALLGANGAGKSTLSRIIAGLVLPTSGTMSIDGDEFSPKNKRGAEQRYVQIVQQELNIVPTLSVAENIYLNRLPSRFGFVDRRKLHRLARVALDSVGLNHIEPERPAGSLGVGVCQLVEIASALSRQCRILILDEPTAALTASETARLFARLKLMTAAGVSVIYITHRLGEVTSVCDRLSVLRDGCLVDTARVTGTSERDMVAMMTGEEQSHDNEFQSHHQSTVAMRVDGLSRSGVLQEVSFEVRRGERLGVAGLVGAGRTELLRSIFGADPAEQGTVSLAQAGRLVPYRFTHPKQAVCQGLAMVTEERKHDGLLLSQPARINLSLATLSQFANIGFLNRHAERDACGSLSEKLAVKCNSIEQHVMQLSGGNQQKIVLGKWLLADTAVLLLDEPTRGIDVGSRQRIYRIIEAQAATGVAIVIVSSDLQELMDQCDTIVVMAGGRLVARFERRSWSVAAITAACFVNPELTALE